MLPTPLPHHAGTCSCVELARPVSPPGLMFLCRWGYPDPLQGCTADASSPFTHPSLPSAHVQGHLMGPSTWLSRLGAGKEGSVLSRCPLPIPRGEAGSWVSWVQGSEGCGVLRGVQCQRGLGACGFPSFSLAQ